MVEAELFGYEAGAFPGALRPRFGKFEHARNGTLFLDFAHTVPVKTQAKLLQVVQERKITRLGGSEPIELNCRFIGASIFDPADAEGDQIFSLDLLYSLNVIALRVPSLSERMEDIPALFSLLVEQSAVRLRREVPPPPSDIFLSGLLSRNWPGNMRDMRTLAERYVLGIDDLDEMKPKTATGSLGERVAAFERQVITAELEARNGQLKSVYQSLNMSRKTLYEKMQKYGLNRADFRD
jgi:two-component system C4-dicarboxylate transport response regulator DctD